MLTRMNKEANESNTNQTQRNIVDICEIVKVNRGDFFLARGRCARDTAREFFAPLNLNEMDFSLLESWERFQIGGKTRE